MSGKPGRPREDAFRRRLEIYTAAAPLIEAGGAKGLTMRQAARAANISLGGLHHYFRSKRELLLFGISPEMLSRSCHDFHAQSASLRQADPVRFVASAIDALGAIVVVARPSLLASIELGIATALETVEQAMTVTLDDLSQSLRAFRELSDTDLEALQRAVRRVVLGAMLDRTASARDIKDELRTILQTAGQPVKPQPIRPQGMESSPYTN